MDTAAAATTVCPLSVSKDDQQKKKFTDRISKEKLRLISKAKKKGVPDEKTCGVCEFLRPSFF